MGFFSKGCFFRKQKRYYGLSLCRKYGFNGSFLDGTALITITRWYGLGQRAEILAYGLVLPESEAEQ
jgi:hypothetical protein